MLVCLLTSYSVSTRSTAHVGASQHGVHACIIVTLFTYLEYEQRFKLSGGVILLEVIFLFIFLVESHPNMLIQENRLTCRINEKNIIMENDLS